MNWSSVVKVKLKSGIGYDVHALEFGIPLILGGILISSDYGCKSHTDGDTLTHAIIDALLGASGKQDIGFYFPPEDVAYKNCKSTSLLEKTINIIKEFEIINIDSVVVAQSPKLGSYRERIRNNIARICKINEDQVNVKFKTEECLGFTGSLKGIKAIASCLIRKI